MKVVTKMLIPLKHNNLYPSTLLVGLRTTIVTNSCALN